MAYDPAMAGSDTNGVGAQDAATVQADGQALGRQIHGVQMRDLILHTDDRGTVCELYDERWGWHPDPVVFTYVFSVRPGKTKGWGMHLEHEDRYALIAGELEVAMYDAREDSPTSGMVSSVVLTAQRRQLLSVPTGVWHANRNIGSVDAVVLNFPTKPYDHDSPDKYRLPLDTDEIPYPWPDPNGW